jgi:ABC-type transport system involved in multi-copper enzyme maturation permease subunit
VELCSALARNEWLKTKKRPASMICLGLFAAVHIFAFTGAVRSEEGLALPWAWTEILAGAPQVAALTGTILLILLVTNEFAWRTVRQNVIDGLSREEWFLGKLILVPILLVVFLGTQILLGLIFALVGSGGQMAGLVPGPDHWRALGGTALGFCGYASLGLAVAVAVRSPGASVGVLFLWILLVEELLASWLARLSDSLVPLAQHFPLEVFDALMRQARRAPELWSAPRLLVASYVWILLLVGGSYLVFRRRDL